MSSGRPSRIAAPNAERRRWGSSNSYPKAPRHLCPRSHNCRPSTNNHKCPAIRPSPNIRSNPCRPNNRSPPRMVRAIRHPNHRACRNVRRHPSTLRHPATGFLPPGIRRGSPGMAVFGPWRPSTGRHPARHHRFLSAKVAIRRRPYNSSSRHRRNHRTAVLPRHLRKVASRTRARGFRPTSPRDPFRAIRRFRRRQDRIRVHLRPCRLRTTCFKVNRRRCRPKTLPARYPRRVSISLSRHSSRRRPPPPLLDRLGRQPACRRHHPPHRCRRQPQARPVGRPLHRSTRRRANSVPPPRHRPARHGLLSPMARREHFPLPNRPRQRAASVRPHGRPTRPGLQGRCRNRAAGPRSCVRRSSCGRFLRSRLFPTRLDRPAMPRPSMPRAASTCTHRDASTLLRRKRAG